MDHWNAHGALPVGPSAADLHPELKTMLESAYKTTPATPSAGAACAAAVADSGNSETFDLSSLTAGTLTVQFSVDGGIVYIPIIVDVTVTATANSRADAALAADIVADLNGNTMFSLYLEASDNSGAVRITSKAIGSDVKIYVVDEEANTPLGYTEISDATAAAGTGTPIDIEADCADCAGQVAAFRRVTVAVYDAASAGALVSTAQIQAVSKGRLVSGGYTNLAEIESDENGEVDFQVADTGSNTDYLEMSGPAELFLVGLAVGDRTTLTFA